MNKNTLGKYLSNDFPIKILNSISSECLLSIQKLAKSGPSVNYPPLQSERREKNLYVIHWYLTAYTKKSILFVPAGYSS